MSLTFEQELFLLARSKSTQFIQIMENDFTTGCKRFKDTVLNENRIIDDYLKFYQEAEKLKNATSR